MKREVSKKQRLVLGILGVLAFISIGVAIWSTIATREETGIRTLRVKSVNDWSILRFPVLPKWNITTNGEARITSVEAPSTWIAFSELERGVRGPDARDEGRLRKWLVTYSKAKPETVKMGSMMKGTIPFARISYDIGSGRRRTYAVFIVRGIRFLATFEWSNSTAEERLLTRELNMMFFWVEYNDQYEQLPRRPI